MGNASSSMAEMYKAAVNPLAEKGCAYLEYVELEGGKYMYFCTYIYIYFFDKGYQG